MRVLRAFLPPRLAAMSLLMTAAAGHAAAPAPAHAQSVAAQRPSVASPGSTPAGTAHLSHGRFKDLPVYQPAGTPSSFVLLISGDEGWNGTADLMARQLVEQGAMVAAIDWPKLKANLEADGDDCVFPDGDLENLSHFVQAYFHVPTYLMPMLAGVSSGAAMAYAVLAQAPPNTFAAALTLGFCPQLDLRKPLCTGSGLQFTRNSPRRGVDLLPIASLGNPWVDLHGDIGGSCPVSEAQGFIARIRGAAIVPLPKLSRDYAPQRAWLPQYTAGFQSLAAHN
ncbi:MAG: hypothetical protein WBF89_03980, partial [Steroidobacteraceae bacterium]